MIGPPLIFWRSLAKNRMRSADLVRWISAGGINNFPAQLSINSLHFPIVSLSFAFPKVLTNDRRDNGEIDPGARTRFPEGGYPASGGVLRMDFPWRQDGTGSRLSLHWSEIAAGWAVRALSNYGMTLLINIVFFHNSLQPLPLAYIAVEDLQVLNAATLCTRILGYARVQSLLLAGNFLYNQ